MHSGQNIEKSKINSKVEKYTENGITLEWFDGTRLNHNLRD